MNIVKEITDPKFFESLSKEDLFVGRPYKLSFDKASILISDYWKYKVGGVPQGSFLLAEYDNPYDEKIKEVLLLRVLQPSQLPTDNSVISSMVEYYKDNLKISGKKSELDDFTRYEFSFSGLECRVLGTFYLEKDELKFGADLESYYSAHNYKVFKATDDVLLSIVNQRDSDILPGNESEFKIGTVRYSSSLRQSNSSSIQKVPVYISSTDILGKRTALFGMTRTGKSNTVKKVIEATVHSSSKCITSIKEVTEGEEPLPAVAENGFPSYGVGQIIFDINGEYANANLQDAGTAIFDMYKGKTVRYSILDKGRDFKIMRVNFYNDIKTGFEYIESSLAEGGGDYVTGLRVIDFEKPDEKDISGTTRYNRKVSAYQCCLFRATYEPPTNFKVKFKGCKELNDLVEAEYGKIVPNDKTGIRLSDAVNWWKVVWENRNHEFFSDYRRRRGKDWIDEELASLLTFLTQTKPGGQRVSGYTKLKSVLNLHTASANSSFQVDILDYVRDGKIVIVDLSQGNPTIQKTLSERICQEIFNDSMRRFTKASPNNFVQFYFEEAHNLFPKKDDKDLSQIYNRIAKEGAKLGLGMIYATQEVSSISSNILKNTQNWFIAHLNNEDETKELRKYYDFSDFTDSLIRFSAKTDKGFVRMKTYSNPFVVPVQIGLFKKNIL